MPNIWLNTHPLPEHFAIVFDPTALVKVFLLDKSTGVNHTLKCVRSFISSSPTPILSPLSGCAPVFLLPTPILQVLARPFCSFPSELDHP